MYQYKKTYHDNTFGNITEPYVVVLQILDFTSYLTRMFLPICFLVESMGIDFFRNKTREIQSVRYTDCNLKEKKFASIILDFTLRSISKEKLLADYEYAYSNFGQPTEFSRREEKYHGCPRVRLIYDDFCKRRKQGKPLGPTPLASCKQCFLRNQGYCIEVGMWEETVRERGERGDEHARMQIESGSRGGERAEVSVGGETEEDKGRVEPSVWGCSITAHQRAEFSRQANPSESHRGVIWWNLTDIGMLHVPTRSTCVFSARQICGEHEQWTDLHTSKSTGRNRRKSQQAKE